MNDENKIKPRPLFHRNTNWDPFRDWEQPKDILDHCVGLPSFLDQDDRNWIEWAKRRLTTPSWPGSKYSPLFTLSCMETLSAYAGHQTKISEETSEMKTEQGSWKIILNVSHFSPEEITVTAKDSFLEITGKHGDRWDEHGIVSRSFTRKYKLSSELDLQHISCTRSEDGTLRIEAQTSAKATTNPTDTIIPIKILES